MLDHRHGLAGNQISSFNPAYQIHRNCDGTGDIEFDFWDARKTRYYDSFNNLDSCEIEFQVQTCADEESFATGDRPLPIWGANKVTDASPLLPNSHLNSNLSPRTRIRAIEEGRKELMEMIRNLPESSYELSLKDIVDHQQHASEPEEVKGKEAQAAVPEDKIFLVETGQMKKQKNKKKKKRRKAEPICRSGSMDTDSFLIKTFLPSSLSFRKKSISEKSSKVSPSPSSEVSKKPVDSQWWIKRVFIRKNHKNREDSKNNNSSKSRYGDSSFFLPSFWLFFLFKKGKGKRQ
ncbi:hypothetical protein CCACVL1_25914 [Corchorus capsularis]|uniref:Uncharacterized protein n=1 Tax=Corchorus capsularis TaxID=210143 RepID=A0A1R3GGK0_COCAP|nr:hypothetical protein CCACVL1_25914 [Corchorus capsularis]